MLSYGNIIINILNFPKEVLILIEKYLIKSQREFGSVAVDKTSKGHRSSSLL